MSETEKKQIPRIYIPHHRRLTEREMLLTLAGMALTMDDLTGHDVIESMKALGHGDLVEKARAAK